MAKIEKCIVYQDKIYCWDDVNQRPIEVEMVEKKSSDRIPEDALNLLFKKLLEVK